MNAQAVLDKLTSRKFWMATAFIVVATVGDELGMNVDPDTLRNIALVVLTYLGAQGFVDAGGLDAIKAKAKK